MASPNITVGDLVWTCSDAMRASFTALRVCAISGGMATVEFWSPCATLNNPHVGDGCTCTPKRFTCLHDVAWLTRCPTDTPLSRMHFPFG